MKYLLSLLLFLAVSSTAFATTSTDVAIHPNRHYIMTPDSLGLKYDQITLTTPDGYRLNSWKIYPIQKDRNTTIVVAYGDAGNMSYYLYQARALARRGYTILLFDYRGFGHSQDFKMNLDYLYYNAFATDLATALNWAKEHINNQKTGIWALSMGTIIATLTLQHHSADFLIGEGFVIDPALAKKRVESKDNPIILPKGYHKYPAKLASLNIPMLIFAGTKDQVTTVADAKKIVKQQPNRKLVIYNGKHLTGFWKLSKNSFGDVYCHKINAFIAKL